MATALAVLLGATSTAFAGELLATDVSAGDAVDRRCAERKLSAGAGFAQQRVTMPAAGAVTARLNAARGDWDLAIFDADSGRVVAGSAYSGSDEVASGFATSGERLVVQACRLSGDSASAGVTVESTALDLTNVAKTSLVRVSTPTAARKQELVDLGLDVTEHGGPGYLEVVLHGAEDAEKLVQHAFMYTLEVPDLSVQARNDRQADLAFAASTDRSELPSGRTTYRLLADYSAEMKQLVHDHPGLARSITLKSKTYEGRPVEGIEIATNPDARDGRPVFLQMGVHHAREWPSSEHAMEWAYELIKGYRSGDARITQLVQNTRTIIVPVVNPDGFNQSREAGQLYMHGDGAGTDLDGSGDISDEEFILAAAAAPNEYKRKNCRFLSDANGGSCLQPDTGIIGPGVDPNRNYGGFWGGAGASATPLNQTYRGPGPFSEPETQNVRELISSRQVTALITNHTFSNLVLRPPGIAIQGETPDEPLYKALGDAMAAHNGYASQFGYQLYDTTGTTEDWSYYATGGFGFTFEIGDL
ncbi:MAG TPA: M14 family metallopeptidase, partial [Solirubrobacteraceae bacterium]|nr:M14 family metallopeptidase [Solirubrobacteraceae bacterium]